MPGVGTLIDMSGIVAGGSGIADDNGLHHDPVPRDQSDLG